MHLSTNIDIDVNAPAYKYIEFDQDKFIRQYIKFGVDMRVNQQNIDRILTNLTVLAIAECHNKPKFNTFTKFINEKYTKQDIETMNLQAALNLFEKECNPKEINDIVKKIQDNPKRQLSTKEMQIITQHFGISVSLNIKFDKK